MITGLGDRMTLAEFTNAINRALALKHCFQRDFHSGNINKDGHMFLCSVAMRKIFTPSTTRLYAYDF